MDKVLKQELTGITGRKYVSHLVDSYKEWFEYLSWVQESVEDLDKTVMIFTTDTLMFKLLSEYYNPLGVWVTLVDDYSRVLPSFISQMEELEKFVTP